MKIDWWTLGFQIVNALVLVWILARFLFRPVAAIVAARRGEADKLLADARAAQAAASADREKAVAEIATTAAGRSDVLKAATAEAATEKTTLLAAAQAEADRIRDAAQAEIDRAKAIEAVAAGDRASLLAVDIVAKLFARLPDTARVGGFVDGLAEAIAALPEAARTGIGGGPIHIRAVRALTEGETQACRAALGRVLGHSVDIAVDVDPALIAGLEMDTPHVIVRNSFRADLDRIVAALTTHDVPVAAPPNPKAMAPT